MKKAIFIMALFLLSTVSSFGQLELLDGKVGFSFSVLNSGKQYASTEVEQKSAVLSNGFLAFSVDYFYPFGKTGYEIETGLSLTRHSLIEYPFGNRTVDTENRYGKSLFYIPVGIRKSFLKYGYANGGLLLDINHKTGIGSYFGVGAKVDSPIGLSLYIGPYAKAHSILGFGKNKSQFFEAGIKIGIIYPFGKLLQGEGRGF